MGSPMELKPDMSVTDLAFAILKKHGKPMHFKDLIQAVMQVKAINQENPGRLIAQMHTEINLDSRFVHQGGGEWGLREWLPKTNRIVHIKPDGTAGRVSRPSLQLEPEEEEELEVEPEEEELEELTDELDDEYSLDDVDVDVDVDEELGLDDLDVDVDDELGEGEDDL